MQLYALDTLRRVSNNRATRFALLTWPIAELET